MAELIYLDTNIYLDYWENRSDKMRPLGDYAFNVLKRALKCEFIIITSNLVFKELDGKISNLAIENIFNKLDATNKLERISQHETDIVKAREIAKTRNTHPADVLHAILAKRAGAKYLITRNQADFEELDFIIEAVFPEDI